MPNLDEAHSDDSQQLPIPVTFVNDQNGIITWRQFALDYKKTIFSSGYRGGFGENGELI